MAELGQLRVRPELVLLTLAQNGFDAECALYLPGGQFLPLPPNTDPLTQTHGDLLKACAQVQEPISTCCKLGGCPLTLNALRGWLLAAIMWQD